MADEARQIRLLLKRMEQRTQHIEEFHQEVKSEGGRLTQFGRAFVALSKEYGLKQSLVAKLLEISPGAVSQHYAKE